MTAQKAISGPRRTHIDRANSSPSAEASQRWTLAHVEYEWQLQFLGQESWPGGETRHCKLQ